jgi:hypothetical protein
MNKNKTYSYCNFNPLSSFKLLVMLVYSLIEKLQRYVSKKLLLIQYENIKVMFPSIPNSNPKANKLQEKISLNNSTNTIHMPFYSQTEVQGSSKSQREGK